MMYELSQITGDDKYAQAADDAYAFFLENAQSPVTWLLGWGENLYWDTRADKVDAQDDFFHEPFSSEKCPDIGRLFDLNPQVCYQYALGMWRNQIHNHETGNSAGMQLGCAKYRALLSFPGRRLFYRVVGTWICKDRRRREARRN